MSQSPSKPIGVLLADSSPMQLQLLTSALRRRPEFKVASCPLDADLVLQMLASVPIHVLVLGVGRPDSALEEMALLRRLHVSYPQVAKIVLLESANRELVVNAFRSGARGLFCFAQSPFRALCKCIQVVHRGQVWASSQQIDYLIDLVSQVPSLRVINANGNRLLTPREEQVVALVAEGLSNREIAQELKLSEHTIKKYVFRIFDKLGISTRVELVLYAVNHGDHRRAEWLPALHSSLGIEITGSITRMTKTLILSPRYTPDSIALRNAALELGWAVERLRTWRPPDHLAEADVVPYGEPLFAAVVADSLQLALLEPRLSWIAEIPADLRRRELQFTDLATARALDRPAFIKPADDKCFQARVYTTGSELPETDSLGAMNPVIISEPVFWESEFRCFVLENQVVTQSIYSRNGDVVETEDGNWPASPSEFKNALEFANRVLQDSRVSFPPAGVLDVGVIRDRGWAVVEANACWGAGIYGCNPRSVMETLARACVKRATLTEADREWVLARTNWSDASIQAVETILKPPP